MTIIFKKGSPVKSKNINLDISVDITNCEHNKTYKYSGIKEVNNINYSMNKKIKLFYRRWMCSLAEKFIG